MLIDSKTLVQVLFQAIVIIAFCQNLAAEGEDEYFYDSELSENDIKKIQEEKKLKEELLKNLQTTTKATTPEFFAPKKTDDQKVENWDQYYMEKMVKAYMDKYQEEQLQKRRLKFETDLNHPLLSIITLTAFFGISSFVGLIIVYVRGKQFRKNNTNATKGEKKIYKPVDANEDVVA